QHSLPLSRECYASVALLGSKVDREMLVPLSEREDIGPDPGIQEFDLEGSIADRPRLPDELVQTRFAHAPPPFSVHIKAMVGPGRNTIKLDAEADGVALGRRTQDEVKIT